ncbi:hypothetical protein KAI04_02630 [Candidatus Pacearchaeota archaeon]|nr:hypothetical protein [Candidatus Pacearchaeota archaeon]
MNKRVKSKIPSFNFLSENRRGQVTIFIIIAVIIITGVSLFFILRESSTKNLEVPVEVSPIKNFIDLCIEESIEESISKIGIGGGYFIPPKYFNANGFTYYFYEGVNYFPSREDLEEELLQALFSEVELCLNNFQNFKNYDIRRSELKIDVDLFDDQIVYNLELPLKISFDEKSYLLEDFGEHTYYVKLGSIYDGIYDLIENDYYNEERVCLSCFNDMILERDLKIDLLQGGIGSSLFVISDYNEEYNKTFEFVFAV